MNRTVLTTHAGENLMKHTVRIEGRLGPDTGQQSFADLMNLLGTIRDTPDMVRHGADCPESIQVYHSGSNWVVEAVCLVDRAPQG